MGEKKIMTLLLGSPRTGGNTEKMADALARGAEAKGWETRKVRLAAMDLQGCSDCRKCWSSGKPCVKNDDMDKVYADIEAAATLAFVSPVYFYSWTTQIKPVWDRLLPYISPDSPRSVKGKKAVLLSAAGDSENEAFEGITASFRRISAFLGFDIAGEVYAPGVYGKEDIETKAEILEQAEALGANLPNS